METKLVTLRQNEALIDNYITDIDFKSSLVDLRNNIHLALSLKNINNIYKISDEDVDGRIDIYTSIYTYLKEKLNKNIEPALEWDGYDLEYNENMSSELEILGKYKMLFNILPLVHRKNKNIYSIDIDSNLILIEYLKDDYFKFECYDILFTRINLLANYNNTFNSLVELKEITKSFFNTGKNDISYDDKLEIYKKFVDKYIEIYQSYFYMLSDDFLFPIGNFTLNDFKKFFAGIYILNQISIEIVGCFLLKNNKARYDAELHEYFINDVFNCKENYDTFREFFCNLTELDANCFDNIIRYFLVDYDKEEFIDLSGEEYIPPFIKKNGDIYFNTIFNTILINPRNIIYSLKELSIQNKDSVFDNNSAALSVNFINTFSVIFESYDLKCVKERKWDNGNENSDIDLIVCCHKTKNILLIECKAIIAATNYKSFFKMQDRVEEGIEQLKIFESLKEDFKFNFLSDVLGADVRNYHLTSCLASDGGFGNALIWDNIFENEFVPMNLSMIILYLEKFKDLINFREKFYKLIYDLNIKTDPQVIKCKIDFSQECGAKVIIHDSTQANYMNLTEEKKIIHTKLRTL